ncbi:MAG TPA: DUF2520 domain-containing protein [Chitinophagaceae bacterium]|nr:DUF2520 domain-containing protein [Chitinophagaceae bacterium]HRX93497.1 DUF2520 domain-containing protein [Chitinophagaceae bacterium]
MRIVIIGTGNAASVLGRKFKAAGHSIVQVYGRNTSAASKLAYEWDTDSTNYISLITKEADVYIIAVQDDAIAEVVKELQLPGKVVAHTAASVPKEVLAAVTGHYGVFYPLQSLRKEVAELPDIPIFTDGSDDTAIKQLEKLAKSIAGDNVSKAGNDDRRKMHVAAVVVNNFTNHLFALAEDYCKKEGLDFQQLIPLIEETISRLRSASPSKTQTGPAIRHDRETIQQHLELLNDHPQLKNVYLLLTESIQQWK